jgi:tetratricopeptide (TPR) repeat protein
MSLEMLSYKKMKRIIIVLLIAFYSQLHAQFQSFDGEVSRAKSVIEIGRTKLTPASDGLGALFGNISGSAETVKFFINEDPQTGRTSSVKFLWNDWSKDIGHGVHADSNEAVVILDAVCALYAAENQSELKRLFWGQENSAIMTQHFNIEYTFHQGPAINERMIRIKEIEVQQNDSETSAHLEALLKDGYNALKTGSYDEARKLYSAAIALAPESRGARVGLEKASALYLANIRYTQNITSAANCLKEGRYPRAAKFFNDAMASRPSSLPPSQIQEESRIRTALTLQSREVGLQIVSDKKTYVSIIGVFAPERFKSKDLKLYPDVYKLKGTRRGYRSIEVELKVDAQSSKEIEMICTEKQ